MCNPMIVWSQCQHFHCRYVVVTVHYFILWLIWSFASWEMVQEGRLFARILWTFSKSVCHPGSFGILLILLFFFLLNEYALDYSHWIQLQTEVTPSRLEEVSLQSFIYYFVGPHLIKNQFSSGFGFNCGSWPQNTTERYYFCKMNILLMTAPVHLHYE